MGRLADRGGAKLVRVWLGVRDSSLGESARFVHEMYKAVQPVAGVKERVEGEVVGVEVGVVLPEDVTEGLVVGTFAYDMMPCLQGRVSDFVCTRAPGGFGWNKVLVVLAGVTVTSNSLYNSAEEFAGGIFEDLIGGDRRGDDCHRYDFLVRRLERTYTFFELFKLYFHLRLITTPHVLYVHMTYVYSFSSCFILHTMIRPREVIIVL